MSNLEIDSHGNKRWLDCNGILHRLEGPAWEEVNGDKSWYVNGNLHRVGGPAIIYGNGNKWWCINSIKHRLDGPAWEGADGSKEWWVEGVKVSEKDYPQAVLMYKCRMVLES